MSRPAAIQQLIKRNLTIPTIPEIVIKVTQLVQDPNSGTREIGALIAEDPPLAAKVLKIANSAFYGMAKGCVSTEHASTMLGLRVLRNIVTQVAVIRQFDHLSGGSFDVSELWMHSSMTAHVCSQLATQARNLTELTPHELYVCGLLHDIGKVVMLEGLGDEYVETCRASKGRDLPMFAVEKQRFGFNHCEVGAVVASRWALPQELVRAIEYHHGPRERVAESRAVMVVANANLLVHRIEENNLPAAYDVFDDQTRTALGLGLEQVEAVIEFARQNVHVVV